MPIVKAYLGTTPLFSETTTTSADWVRPADWLTLPLATANSVRGLYAVFNQTENYVTVQMGTNDNSTYTIDWGDGTVTTNAASNTLIIKNYDYNNVALNGTLSTRGYKQAIITVTAQAGKTFNLCRIDVKPTTPAGFQNGMSSGWLDLNINLPNLIAGQRLYIGGSNFIPRLLERVNITSWGAITNLNEMFRNTASLQSINDTEWNMTNITGATNMFFSSGIRKVDGTYWNMAANQNFSNMFRDCPYLRSVKCANWNTAAGTNFASMFMAAVSLDDADVTNWNVGNGTNFSYMFQGCRSLRNINVANWNPAKATVINNMFEGCTALTEIVTTNWTLPLCTNATSFIQNCPNLRKVGPLNLSAVTTYTSSNFAVNCYSLVDANFTGIKASVLFTNGMLGATELNALYNGLATVVGQTITVTGNYGTATDDPTIATGKGWTVTG